MTEQTKIQNAAKKTQAEEAKAESPPLNAKEEWAEILKTALIAVIIAVIIRTFMYEPFNIPSSSMKPTLDVGDYLFVHKPSYGYSRYSFPFGLAPLKGRVWGEEPQRGDVVVFWNSKTSQNYIKRLIGLPGETIQVKRGRLYINNKRLPRKFVETRRIFEGYSRGEVMMHEYTETLPDGTTHAIYEEGDDRALDNTKKFTVPGGHYFFMGDNRDNSQDSRVDHAVGFVPYENLVGRADFIFYSTNGKARLFEIWKWPQTIRYSRLFQSIDPVRP